jgi:large subunit ribosomal protein L9
MKVILSQSYMNLGEVGTVVDVKPGYARNFLVPQKIAVTATKGNLQKVADRAKAIEAQRATERDGAKKLLSQLEGLSIKIVKKVSEDGRLYGAVTTKEIEAAFLAAGAQVDRRQVVMGQQIKSAGEFNILVKLVGGLKASVPLKVEGENAPKGAHVEDEEKPEA